MGLRCEERKGERGALDQGCKEKGMNPGRGAAWTMKGVVDSERFSRRLAHDSTKANVILLNFRVRNENG